MTLVQQKIHELNGILQPEPVKFEPVTLGWFIVAGLIVIFIIYLTIRVIKYWYKRKYRRVAIRSL